jgi:hypothetical protein
LTVSSTIAVATLGWTGAETVWSPGFQAQGVDDVAIVYTVAGGAPFTLIRGTHFTAAIDALGAYSAYPAAGAMPAPSGTVTIARTSTLQQAASFQDGVPVSAAALGAALDLAALRDQELRRDVAALQGTIDAVAATAVAAAVGALFAALPTVEPAAAGIAWNNGGVICISGP